MIVKLFEGGYLERLLLVLLVWGGILIIAIQGRDVPSWLLVAGSTVLGWFFKGTTQQQQQVQQAQLDRQARPDESHSVG